MSFVVSKTTCSPLSMWGFVAYATATSVMVYSYPTDAVPPAYWPQLWWVGAAMVLQAATGSGSLSGSTLQRGNSPFRFVRADLLLSR